jgi:hypothetical protein
MHISLFSLLFPTDWLAMSVGIIFMIFDWLSVHKQCCFLGHYQGKWPQHQYTTQWFFMIMQFSFLLLLPTDWLSMSVRRKQYGRLLNSMRQLLLVLPIVLKVYCVKSFSITYLHICLTYLHTCLVVGHCHIRQNFYIGASS